MEDEDFFKNYSKFNEKNLGIPNIRMNSPLFTGTLPKGKIGLELEIEGTKLPNGGHLEKIAGSKSKSTWISKPDGSLRGENYEYVLNIPCFIEEVPPLVDGLFKVFKDHKTILRNSNRCSTHVHVNVGDEKVNVLTSILVLWSTFENIFIEWTGEERKNNHYCLPNTETHSTIDAWDSLLTSGNQRLPEGIKYSSLNVKTLWKFGSFEFRIGRAADEPEYVKRWTEFLFYFVEFVKRNYVNPYNISYDLSERGPNKILESICDSYQNGRSLYKEFVEIQDLDSICMKAFRNVQHLVFKYPWENWLVEINKEYVPNPFSSIKSKKTSVREITLEETPP